MNEHKNLIGDRVVTIPAVPLYGHKDPDYSKNVGVYGLSGYQLERASNRYKDLGVKLSDGIPKGYTVLIIWSFGGGGSIRYIEAIGRVALRIISDNYLAFLKGRGSGANITVDYDMTHSQAKEILLSGRSDMPLRHPIPADRLTHYLKAIEQTDAFTNEDDYIVVFDVLMRYEIEDPLLLFPPEAKKGKSEARFKSGFFRPVRLFTKEEILPMILKETAQGGNDQ